MSRRTLRGLGVLFVAAFFFATPVSAQDPPTLDLEAVGAPGAPFISLHACYGDCALGTGAAWHVLLSFLGQTAISGCSVHGPHITSPVDPSLGQDLFVGATRVRCGVSHNMVVRIQQCHADISLHGYVHADEPDDPFLGLTTIDVHVEKVPAPENVKLNLTLHDPKKNVELHASFPGTLNISSCPF